MDNEEKKILTDQEKLKLMTEHEGWDVARKMLVEKIQELSMISSIQANNPQDMFVEMKANKTASEILFNFLLNDIEGTVQQHINNKVLSTKQDSFIIREI